MILQIGLQNTHRVQSEELEIARNITIDNANKLGKKQKEQNPRPVIVNLCSLKDEYIKNRASVYIKETEIDISEDLPKDVHETRTVL